MRPLKCFWRYYGGKTRAAKLYPEPSYDTIIEPFAGAAGYSLRYPDREVILADVDPRVVGVWDYLIRAPEAEIQAIPECRSIANLPAWVPQEGRWLVGWWLSCGTARPGAVQHDRMRQREASGLRLEYWNQAVKDRITAQQPAIRHWMILHASYQDLPNAPATWFIDPPYQGKAGRNYTFNAVDFRDLAAWCRAREGQPIVCEAFGANWLPFRELAIIGAQNGGACAEVIWP